MCHHISTGVHQLCKPAADTSGGSFVPKHRYLRRNIRRVTTEGNNNSEGRAPLSKQISRHQLFNCNDSVRNITGRRTALSAAQGEMKQGRPRTYQRNFWNMRLTSVNVEEQQVLRKPCVCL